VAGRLILPDPDVICVGAGMSGAHAARRLADAGLRVLVLEGREVAGGRTRVETIPGSDFRAEIGGGWVMPDRQPMVRGLAERFGVGYVEGPAADRWDWVLGSEHRRGEHPLTSAEGRELLRAMSRLRRESRLLAERREAGDREWIERHDVSLAAWVDGCGLSAAPRQILLALIGNAFNSRPDEVSVLNAHLVVADYGGDPWRGYSGLGFQLADGTTRLIEGMLDDASIEVRTGADVRRIADTASGVIIETADGAAYSAAAAVVTVPVATYPRISIDVPNPHLELIAQGNPGRAFKAWFRVAGLEGFPFVVSSEGPIRKLRCEANDGREAILVAIGNNLAPGELSDPVRMSELLAALIGPCDVRDLLAHDWAYDEFSAGGWYAAPPGAVADLVMARPVAGAVQFAGSDLAADWNGWIEGALESGAAAADRVLEHLGPRIASAARD